MSKKVILLLILISSLSLFLNLYKKSSSPPCFNADEAAFGYNAYSILKTGKDEYGNLLPLRLKSFGDYKMPLYAYLSIPFIGISGLNEGSTRDLNTFISIFFPLVIFFLAKEMFKNNKIALLSAFLVSVSVAIDSIGRQAHEAYLASFLISLAAIFFIRTIKNLNIKNTFIFSFLILLALFSYQSSRIFAIYFLIISIIYRVFLKKLNSYFFSFLILALILFTITDIIYKPERVKNLLFFNNIGFTLKINELINEGGSRVLYNKATVGLRDLVFEYSKYFSPQFLMIDGDTNPRFGYKGLALITPLEFILFFIGLYYLFKNKEKWRFFLLGLLLISPFSASLAWTDLSLTRSLFFIIPILIICSYGVIYLLRSVKLEKYRRIILIMTALIFFLFLVYNWSFYLFHYPKRALVVRSWQCGYRDLASYIQNNYNNFDRFYITKKNGQPYIFFLFYLKYNSNKYQKIASLSLPDEYGFGQVQAFDKFIFDFKVPKKEHRYIAIGYPDDFTSLPKDEAIDLSKIIKIKTYGQDMFWIYESP